MTTQKGKPQSIFPDFPRENPTVDTDGNLTQFWSLSLSSLYQALQKNFSNEGLRFPPLNSTDMATIAALYAPYINMPLPQDDPSNGTQNTLPDISGASVFNTTDRSP